MGATHPVCWTPKATGLAGVIAVMFAGSIAMAQVGVQEPVADLIDQPPEDDVPVEGGEVVQDQPEPEPPAPEPRRRRRGTPVSIDSLMYAFDDPKPNYPSREELGQIQVRLDVGTDGVVRADPEADPIPLNRVVELGVLFDASAVNAIPRAVEVALLDSNLVANAMINVADQGPLDPAEGTPAAITISVDVGPYPVDAISVRYKEMHPMHPPAEELLGGSVQLSLTPAGWIAADPRFTKQEIQLSSIGSLESQDFNASALRAIGGAIRDQLLDRGLIGVLVVPDNEAIDLQTLEDRRAIDDDSLAYVVYTGIVTKVRTLAFGGRMGQDDRENSDKHRGIIENSPVGVWTGEGPRDDLLRRDTLDAYLFRLNRMLGRRVDAAISPAAGEGAQLDFLISERKPLLGYVQVSNTGTKSTDEWRYRAGFNWAQPFNNDDVFSLDFITAGFDASQAVISSYEASMFGSELWRWRVDANWSTFTASDVGFAEESFEGNSYAFGAEAIVNLYQRRDMFVDAFAGARWQHVDVENTALGGEGDSDFFIPRLGLRLERDRKTARTFGSAWIEGNWADAADTGDTSELAGLGRLFVDREWWAIKGDLRHSFYLEPILNPTAWADVSTPGSSTLAHEIALSVKGQYVPEHRLIPQEEQVAGGMYTVRGYPESAVAGDTVFVASAEYRYHLAKSFGYTDNIGELFGRPFRTRPQEPYGDADWDLIFKGFVDFARAENTERITSFEVDETLIGAGVGLEFSFRRRLSLRVDWGFALEDTESGEVKSGDNEVHFVGTLLF